MQSWAWGEFQQALGNKIQRLQVQNRDGDIFAQALLLELKLPLNQTILYSPLPFIFNPKANLSEQKEAVELLIAAVKKYKGPIFFRLDPQETANPFFAQLYRSLGFAPSKKHLQPRDTLVLDLTKKEIELLSAMKPKTRYNIRLAEKRGVIIKEADSPEEFSTFLKLLEITGKREGFKTHAAAYYRKQFSMLQPLGLEKLFLACYKEKVIAGILVSFFGQRATYLHGGSLREDSSLMAPHLLQWEAIKKARELGCALYDFWGIAPSDDPNHPWAGITRFKTGFGGRAVSYLPSQELTLKPFWHNLYRRLRR